MSRFSVGDEVWVYQPLSGRYEMRRVIEVFPHELPEPLYVVSSGDRLYETELFENHPHYNANILDDSFGFNASGSFDPDLLNPACGCDGEALSPDELDAIYNAKTHDAAVIENKPGGEPKPAEITRGRIISDAERKLIETRIATRKALRGE